MRTLNGTMAGDRPRRFPSKPHLHATNGRGWPSTDCLHDDTIATFEDLLVFRHPPGEQENRLMSQSPVTVCGAGPTPHRSQALFHRCFASKRMLRSLRPLQSRLLCRTKGIKSGLICWRDGHGSVGPYDAYPRPVHTEIVILLSRKPNAGIQFHDMTCDFLARDMTCRHKLGFLSRKHWLAEDLCP